jgi:WS/DGAT/MGAT family acyltransferase
MPKLSAIDLAFFLLETDARPMNVGSLTVLAVPVGMQRNFANTILKGMLKRPVGPPFNFRLARGPLAFLPQLELDESIDPAKQVHRVRLKRGAGLRELFDKVCELHVQRLPRDEPLWQMYLFEGLERGRIAIYFKTHHGIIDGIGFIKAWTGTVTTSSRQRRPRAVWEGIPGATETRRRDKALPEMMADALGDMRGAARTANDFARLILQEVMRGAGLGRGLALPFLLTPAAFKARPSSSRTLGHCVLPLPHLRQLGDTHGVTVNDILLTVLDIAMRGYLEARGEAPDKPLVADMPVALSKAGSTGNQITILQVPLGGAADRPADRLAAIVRETHAVKEQVHALSGESLMAYTILVHAAASAIESLHLSQLPMLANAVISNAYGLAERRYFMGAEVELALPVSVVAHHQTLNITATTYVDELHVTFIAVREALPDIQELADGAVKALAELEADLARSHRRSGRPGAKRRSSRAGAPVDLPASLNKPAKRPAKP